MVGIGEVIVGLLMLLLVIFAFCELNDFNFEYYYKPIRIGGKRCWINKRKSFKCRSFGSNNEFVISKEDAKF